MMGEGGGGQWQSDKETSHATWRHLPSLTSGLKVKCNGQLMPADMAPGGVYLREKKSLTASSTSRNIGWVVLGYAICNHHLSSSPPPPSSSLNPGANQTCIRQLEQLERVEGERNIGERERTFRHNEC